MFFVGPTRKRDEVVAQQTLSDGSRAGHLQPGASRRRLPQPLPLTLDDLFTSTARRFPMARAVQEGHHHLSYGEAENRAAQLASALVRGGVQLGDPVIVHCAGHRQAVVAQLAVLKAGGVCVPLPSALRGARLDRITEVSGARVVLCSTVTRPLWSYRLMSWVLDDPATWSKITAQRPDPSLPRSGHTEAAYLLVSDADRQGVSGYLTDHRAWQQTLSARIRRVGGAHDGVIVHHPPVRTTTLPAMWWAFACGGKVRATGPSLPYGSIRSADGACLAEDTAPVLASGRLGRWRHNGTLEFCDPSTVPPSAARPRNP